MNMPTGAPNKFPRINAQKSKSGDSLIFDDGGTNRVVVSVNLLKHLLQVPYTKKDGTEVTEETFAREKERKASYRNNKMRGEGGALAYGKSKFGNN